MYRNLLLSLLILLSAIYTSSAQGTSSAWSISLGGQVSHAFKSAPVQSDNPAGDFLSGFSPANGLGLLTGVKYSFNSNFSLNAVVGADAFHFSYDLLSPQTFGETQGRTVPGRYFTESKGVGLTGFAAVDAELYVGQSTWSPSLILGGGMRYWIREHSNADAAYDAGYHFSEKREAARQQFYAEAGFGVSPFSANNRISLLYQRTFSPFEPLHNTIVLRQTFSLSPKGKGIACPTF